MSTRTFVVKSYSIALKNSKEVTLVKNKLGKSDKLVMAKRA